jgi:hypothetical protein
MWSKWWRSLVDKPTQINVFDPEGKNDSLESRVADLEYRLAAMELVLQRIDALDPTSVLRPPG